jgi:hypothetical protein
MQGQSHLKGMTHIRRIVGISTPKPFSSDRRIGYALSAKPKVLLSLRNALTTSSHSPFIQTSGIVTTIKD